MWLREVETRHGLEPSCQVTDDMIAATFGPQWKQIAIDARDIRQDVIPSLNTRFAACTAALNDPCRAGSSVARVARFTPSK
jgi:hypothetical protein